MAQIGQRAKPDKTKQTKPPQKNKHQRTKPDQSMKGETSETFRSHYLAQSSIPRLSQLLQQQIGYQLPFIRISWPRIVKMCIICNPMGRFLEIMTKSTYQEAVLASTHIKDISENPTDSGRASLVIEYYLPPSTVSE